MKVVNTMKKTVLIKNIEHVMRERDIPSGKKLADVAGTSQRNIANLLNPEITNVTLETLNKVAKALRVELWHLLCPELPKNIVRLPKSINGQGYELLRILEDLDNKSREEVLKFAQFAATKVADKPGEY